MMAPMKTTLRLPDAIASEATSYAEGLGISLNALCAVALRDYLDGRRRGDAEAPSAAPATVAASPASVASPVPSVGAQAGSVPARAPGDVKASSGAARPVPRVGKNQPCPCGSRKPYGKCHGRAS